MSKFCVHLYTYCNSNYIIHSLFISFDTLPSSNHRNRVTSHIGIVWSVNEEFYRKEIGSVEGIGGLREATGPCESRSEGEREGKRKGMVVVKMRRDRFSDDGLVIVNLDMYTGSWGIP